MSAALYLCLHLPDFAAQAIECAQPELRQRSFHPSKPNAGLLGTPLAILSGTPPLEYVFAVNQQARKLGVARGMSRMQIESFAGVAICRRERALEDRAFAHLTECAGRFSPRIQAISAPQEHSFYPSTPSTGALGSPCEATLALDIANSSRLLGTPEQIARKIEREIRAIGLEANIAISSNAYAAVLAGRGTSGITMIPTGREAQALAPLPLSILDPDEEQGTTLASWGIRTLGQLAALPSRSLAARLGQSGLQLQAQARGEYNHLLVPTEEPADTPLSASMELEHPVELLEPLLLLLNQLLQQLLERALQRALAIASLELSFVLESRTEESRIKDQRTIRPALPERDGLVLLKLIQLELELRPPAAAVIAVRMVAHPARPQRAQQGLFAVQAPEPGRMAVLLARLRKLVGEGRSGSPELLDSRALEAFRMAAFSPRDTEDDSAAVQNQDHSAMRVLRPPREVSIKLCRGTPAVMRWDGQHRRVQASSGPWRTSGEWWTQPGWCREEWEIILDHEPSPAEQSQNAKVQNETLQNEILRLAHDPANGAWYVIGVYD